MLIIKILAVYRLCVLIIQDDWPFEIGAKLRDRIGISYNEHGHQVASNELAKMIICPYCLSLWLALFVSLATKFDVLEILAVSGGAVLLYFIDGLLHGSITITNQ